MDTKSQKLLNDLPDDVAMITKVWGPPTWFFLHSMAMAYPKKININDPVHEEIKKNTFNFLNSLGDVLPCPICGNSYSKYILEPDFNISKHLDSRENLVLFIYKIHNKVNEKLGVPECNIPSLEQVIHFYSKFIAGNPCTATTVKEREIKKLEGCSDNDFKQYKCIVNVVENRNNKTRSINALDEDYFQFNKYGLSNTCNKEKFESNKCKNNLLEDSTYIIIIVILLIIIAIISYFFIIHLKSN